MNERVFFIDMHGVLINSSKMLKNYENILIEIFKKHDVPKDQAIQYHYKGLQLYSTLLNKLMNKNLTGKTFLTEMDIADKKWDKLLQSFVKDDNSSELESRNIEFLAGNHSDSFYEDGKIFIQKLEEWSKNNSNISYYIISNSHSKHIEGLFKGAGFKNFDNRKLLGWDKIESLKNTPYYYEKLNELTHANTKVIIGNSKDEMVLGKNANFKTIFIEREFKGTIDFADSIDLTIKDLQNLPDILENEKNFK